MKVSVIFSEDVVAQLVMTAENDGDKIALATLSDGNQLRLAVNSGHFDQSPRDTSYQRQIAMCEGKYLRAFDNKHSKILVITKPTPEEADSRDVLIKSLLHHKDTTVGLHAIDKDPEDVSLKWIRKNSFQLEYKPSDGAEQAEIDFLT